MISRIRTFLFDHSSAKQIAAKNTVWMFLAEAVSRLAKMALVIFAARMLGTEGWGAFSYALSLGSLLMLFSDAGLTPLIIREAVQEKEGYRSFISTALGIKSVMTILSTLLVVVVGPHLSHIESAGSLFPFIAAILFFDVVRDLGFTLNRPTDRMEREMTAKTLMSIATLGLGFAFFTVTPTPVSLALAYTGGGAIGAIAIWAIIRTDVRRYFGPIKQEMIRHVLGLAWPLALVTVFGQLLANIDVYMLGIWRDAGEIGLYTSAQRIQIFTLIIPTMIATSVFSVFSRRIESDAKGFAFALKKTLGAVMLVALPISAGGILLAPKLITLFFGAAYVAAAPMLSVLMLMLLAAFPLLVLSNAVVAQDKQRTLALSHIAGIGANIALNWILIPRYGAIGAAVATLVSTSLITSIVWKKLVSVTAFPIMPKLSRALVATACMIILVLILEHFGIGLIPIILTATLVYGALLFLLKEPVTREILALLWNSPQKTPNSSSE